MRITLNNRFYAGAMLALAGLTALGIVAFALRTVEASWQGGEKQGQGAATCVKIEGALLQQTRDGFKAVKVGDSIATKTLIIGLPEAELVCRSGKVAIKLLLYVGEALPITESAISFQDSPQVDADISIERGVISLKGLAKGEARVRIRAAKQTWDIMLKDSDSSVFVARFGRHEPGTKLFQGGAKKQRDDDPLMHLGVLVVKGHASVNTGDHSYAMTAPPGPAMVAWDSGAGYEVKRLEELPEEVKNLDPVGKALFKTACGITAKLAAGANFGKGLDQLMASGNAVERRVTVACMGALDDLPRLWDALENTKHPDVRDHAVHSLRNWIGRQPGQLTKLHDHLVKVKKYGPAQARTIEQLLKGFDDQDRREPLVYQLLIGALEHAPLPIRELAHWHLERLAPAGQKITYDAAAEEPARQRAVLQWRQLIPEGQLPPPPKKDEIKKGK